MWRQKLIHNWLVFSFPPPKSHYQHIPNGQHEERKYYIDKTEPSSNRIQHNRSELHNRHEKINLLYTLLNH